MANWKSCCSILLQWKCNNCSSARSSGNSTLNTRVRYSKPCTVESLQRYLYYNGTLIKLAALIVFCLRPKAEQVLELLIELLLLLFCLLIDKSKITFKLKIICCFQVQCQSRFYLLKGRWENTLEVFSGNFSFQGLVGLLKMYCHESLEGCLEPYLLHFNLFCIWVETIFIIFGASKHGKLHR